MEKRIVVAMSYLLFYAVLLAQDDPKPTLSNESLTADQIAIYRAVLNDYLKDSRSTLNLSEITAPFKEDGREVLYGCIRGFKPESAANIVHRLASSTFGDSRVRIVDAGRQSGEVEANDPQKLIKGAIDDGDKVSNKQLDDAVKKAFDSGLFTLSEIVFDKSHLHAMVAYSFVCGGLCGNGNTLAFRRIGRRWKMIRTCSSWIS